MSHTPGPWTCREHDEHGAIVQRGDEGGFIVRGRSQDRVRADARLIAAAPDLLAALETVRRVLQGDQVFDIMLTEKGPCLGNVVRDAIEKARRDAANGGKSDGHS